MASNFGKELLQPVPRYDFTRMSEVRERLRSTIPYGSSSLLPLQPPVPMSFIRVKEQVKRLVADVKGGHVGKEVVPHKKCQKDEIIQGCFNVERTRGDNFRRFELVCEVVTQDGKVQELEVGIMYISAETG